MSASSATPTATTDAQLTDSAVGSLAPTLKRFKHLARHMSLCPRSQPAVRGPEEELSAYGGDIRRGSVTCTATEYWLGHKDQYPSLTSVALDFVSAPASQAYAECIFSVCGKRNRTEAALQ